MQEGTPKVAILMATYNGAEFIQEQIDSIANQALVTAHIYISDDSSIDSTLSVASSTCAAHTLPFDIVLAKRHPLLAKKCSATNFFHLILSTEFTQYFDYFAFSDQDDIWLSDHLYSSACLINQYKYGGVSSDVIAFWPNGRKRYIRKAGYQSKYNHLFESPGPGCSFVLSRQCFLDLRQYLRSHVEFLSQLDFHDWAIYACARNLGYRWCIKSSPALLYRQHSDNVIGVSRSPLALLRRFSLVFGSWYLSQCTCIGHFLELSESSIMTRLTRLSFFDRVYLSVASLQGLRRRFKHRLILFILFLFAK